MVRLVILAFLFVQSPALAVPPPEGVRVVVRAVIDGDTMFLAGDLDGADLVRLVGLQAPKRPPDRPDHSSWPLADAAREALAALVGGRAVTLWFEGRPRDRHRRWLAHVVRDDGLWVQGEMLRRGLAQVHTFADNRARAVEMLTIEDAARATGRGLWAHRHYAVRSADTVGRDIDSFQIVEGRVRAVTRRRDRLFLNFGEDWRNDFTIAVDRVHQRLFVNAGVDPFAFAGRQVRVRGWIKSFNGPLIEATHPEQIELLD